MQGISIYLGAVVGFGGYLFVSRKILDVWPKVGRVLCTLGMAAGYAFIGAIVATCFVGPRYGVLSFLPIYFFSLPKAWRDVGSWNDDLL